MAVETARPLNILVATPLGNGGEGGIDRIMDGIRTVFAADPPKYTRVLFGTTRGRGSLLFSPVYLTTFILRMLWLRLWGRCDLVHVNLASSGSTVRKLQVIAAARAFGIPYVVHLHGSLYRDFFARVPARKQEQIKAAFRNAARVVVLGEIWRDFAVETLGVSHSHVVILPNAAPIPRIGWQSDDAGIVRILFLGKLGERKGSHTLIAGLASIKDSAGWRAVLAGDGEVNETRAAVAREGLHDRVNIPGWLGPEDTAQSISRSDILVLPSFAENLPMSVIEGMAAGLAVVTTPVGATADIVRDGETGLLVKPGDPAELSAAILRLINDAALRRRLGQAAQLFHRQHLEISVYARNLLSIWHEAAA